MKQHNKLITKNILLKRCSISVFAARFVISKERGVVRGKMHRVTAQYGCHSRMPFEFPVEKLADGLPVPAKGMGKIGIKRQVALGKA